MRIKKIAPVTPANGNIENSYGTSQTDTYSQEYINNKIGTYTTLFSGSTRTSATLSEPFQVGHTYIFEFYEFSGSFKKQVEYLHKGATSFQVSLIGVDASNNIIYERYRMIINNSDTTLTLQQYGSRIDCNLTGIYKIL